MTARILESRSKREGGYLGWRKLGPMKRGMSWSDRKKPGHQRRGSELMISTLHERVKAKKRKPRGRIAIYMGDKLIGFTASVRFNDGSEL